MIPELNRIYQGDCWKKLDSFDSDFFDAVVCDPPYELGFMGKSWDSTGIAYNVRMWSEVRRVMKPGAHLLAFGGTRTYHRMACAIEDAGFEIRDQLAWLFGSGFPKSLNCAKAIQDYAYREFLKDVLHSMDRDGDYRCGCSCSCHLCGGQIHSEEEAYESNEPWQSDAPEYIHLPEPLVKILSGIVCKCTASAVGLFSHLSKMDYLDRKDAAIWQAFLEITSSLCPSCFLQLIVGESIDGEKQVGIDWSKIDASCVLSAWAISEKSLRTLGMWSEPYIHYSGEYANYQGYGTALKPAQECICLARKPLSEPTVAANVLKWGTGALNIDGCRVPLEGGKKTSGGCAGKTALHEGGISDRVAEDNTKGRWPANVIHDGSEEVLDGFPYAPGKCGEAKTDGTPQNNKIFGAMKHGTLNPVPRADATKSAARFFYCAKTSRAERGEGNTHPTVKPMSLLSYLVRLITPPRGIVLDPFLGSGSTALAAIREGHPWVGIELIESHIAIAQARIDAERKQIKLF